MGCKTLDCTTWYSSHKLLLKFKQNLKLMDSIILAALQEFNAHVWPADSYYISTDAK